MAAPAVAVGGGTPAHDRGDHAPQTNTTTAGSPGRPSGAPGSSPGRPATSSATAEAVARTQPDDAKHLDDTTPR